MADDPTLADAIRDLVAVLVHDLRNPLAAVVTNLGFARRLVQEGAPAGELDEVIDDSQAACEVLRQLIGNLHVLASYDHTKVTPHEVALSAACSEVIDRCRSRARHASLALELDPIEGNPRAMLDRALFGIGFENLLCNSIQHAPRGTRIGVRVVVAERRARIEVHDEGGAIPLDARASAASVPGQLLQSRAKSGRYNRGAGLLVARIAAELNGSELCIEGEGSASVLSLAIPLI
jgi:signal transduction histidine kinase